MTANRPRLLDLFCGAGGAGYGYHLAGFEVVGVDLKPQPRYPFEFHQADALTFPLDGFDVIHASPPCQGYSQAMRPLVTRDYPLLIPMMRERLLANGTPYVIENVIGADLPSAFILCGMSFELSMHRHRIFETHPFYMLAPGCQHPRNQTRNGMAFSPYNSASREAWGVGKGVGGEGRLLAQLMRVDWMRAKEASEAIPPAYTRFIGEQAIRILQLGQEAVA